MPSGPLSEEGVNAGLVQPPMRIPGLLHLLMAVLSITVASGADKSGKPPGVLSFKAYGIEQGLLNPAAHCIKQDQNGFIWVGTESGLVRFAGGQLQTFGLQEGLPGATVLCLAEAPDGTLWVGTSRGLAYWKNDRFRGPAEDKGLPELAIYALGIGPEGLVRAGTPQGIYVQKGSSHFDLDPVWPGGQVSALCGSPSTSELFAARWVQGRAQVLAWKKGVWTTLDSAPSMGSEVVEAMALDRDHLLWARSLTHLWRYRQGCFQEGPAAVRRAHQARILYADPRGRIWTNADEGLACIDRESIHFITRKDGLPDAALRDVLMDREGSLWFVGNGVFRLRGGGVWHSYGTDCGLPDKVVWCIYRDRGGIRWVGTDRGLARMTPDGFQLIRGTESTQVRSITQGPDGLLYLTGSPYVLCYEPQSGRIQKLDAAQGLVVSRRVFRLVFDPQGDLWVATELHGLFHGVREEGSWRFRQELMQVPHPEESIQDLGVDTSGRLWVPGKSGLFMREGGSWHRFTTQDGLRSNDTSFLAVLRNGDLLGAYFAGAGLYRGSYANGRMKISSTFDDLVPPGQVVYMIGEDTRRNLWAGSGIGVDLITPERKVLHYTSTDGLVGDDINSMAFLADPDGEVWIGTTSGLARFDATSFPGPPSPPQSVILSYSLGKTMHCGSTSEVLRVPRSSSSFEVQCACPSFIQEGDLQRQVRLLGLEEDWHSVSSLRDRFPALPPGKYTFEVRSRIGRGDWGPSAAVRFEVLPAWWQTWWAYACYVGLGFLLIAAVFRIRTRLLRQRTIFLQAQIAKATQELLDREHLLMIQAQDLQILNEQKNQFLGIVAHDLRNPLNGIVLSAQLLEGETDPREVDRVAHQIYREGMDMSGLIGRFLDIAHIESGTIKAEPERFDLAGQVRHIANRHAARAEEKGIEMTFAFEAVPIEAWADLKFTKEVLDNLISNAVKFSYPGTTMTLRCEARGEKVVVSVEDQGPGLTEDDRKKIFGRFSTLSARPTGGEKSTGLGLSIVKHMVDAMHGRIWVESEPGKGAAFHVEFAARQA